MLASENKDVKEAFNHQSLFSNYSKVEKLFQLSLNKLIAYSSLI